MWNPDIYDFKSYNFLVGLLITKGICGNRDQIRIINIYAPYDCRKYFWNKAEQSGLLDLSSIILAGDLKFTIGPIE